MTTSHLNHQVRFAVFGLGSSAYPNFCAFGKYVDNLLGELGGERLVKLATGDEMCGQEQTFHEWAPEVFKIACETFCLDTDEKLYDTSIILKPDSYTTETLRLSKQHGKTTTLATALEKYHNRKSIVGTLKRAPTSLQQVQEADKRHTILIEICSQGVSRRRRRTSELFKQINCWCFFIVFPLLCPRRYPMNPVTMSVFSRRTRPPLSMAF